MTYPTTYVAKVLATAQQYLGKTPEALASAAASLDMPTEAVEQIAREHAKAAAPAQQRQPAKAGRTKEGSTP
ncbi:hypothetical protein [Azohydromonas aeria]|uniref:hypothetical protein n=1 Tax=Azohydromonas aeria TaxID=2590212 RepID=UPI0012F84E51|nr:hypothetical protein [Azohydromonas aeria]